MVDMNSHFSMWKLFKISIPTIIMMIFTSIYGVVDGLFVSNIEGDTAFSGINFILPYVMLFGVVGFMIGAGGSALVSKTYGEGDEKRGNRYFTMLMIIQLFVGAIGTIVGFFTVKDMARILGANDVMLPYAETYGHTLMLFMIFFIFQNSFQSFIVVARKPMLGFLFTVIAGLTNVLGDYLLIAVFKQGVRGAAIASGISQIVGALLPLFYIIFFKHKTPLHFEKTKLEFKPIFQAMSNGLSEMISNLSMSLVNMLFNAQLMKYIGQNGVTAYGIIMYAGFIFTGVYFGYSIGVSSIIAYQYGAKNTKELSSILKKCLMTFSMLSIILATLAIGCAKPIAMIFVRNNPELLSLSEKAIRFYCISYYIAGFNIFFSSFFTDLNDGFVSGIISFARTCFFQVLAIMIFPLIFSSDSLWFSILFAEICSLIISLIFLFTKDKKYHYLKG